MLKQKIAGGIVTLMLLTLLTGCIVIINTATGKNNTITRESVTDDIKLEQGYDFKQEAK